jgi:hypothetical protein
MRQCFVDTWVFVCANVLSTPIVCRRLSFAGTNIFLYFTGAYIFVYFASAYILVCANNLLAPIFQGF